MFSAILSNIFYSRVEETAAEDLATSKFTEASTQTSDNKTASTQVNLDQSANNEKTLNDTPNSQLDWVIVDEMDEGSLNDKACGENLVEMNEEPDKETEDPLIGSFFQKNENDDNDERYKCKPQLDKTDQTHQTVDNQTVLPQPKKNDAWLITPLPCLTSITESSQQKSMIDNDPLENLLIEQPSRFMSASTTEASTPRKRSKKQQQTQRRSQQSEVMQSDDVSYIQNLFTIEPVTPVIKRSTGEKRKEAEKSLSPVSPTPSNESPKKISRKAVKSLKKNNTQKQFNKENMQVKTLLFAETFTKNDTQSKNGRNRYTQMLRANKNAALFSMAGNTKQRKFHNLQQPTIPKNQKF